MFVNFSCVLDHIFSYEHFKPKPQVRRHRKAVRNLWSRFDLDPSTVARVACSRSIFPAGVAKTFSRVSLCEAYFVRTGKMLSVFLALSRAHSPGHTTGRQQNIQRARRYNAAAHKHQQAIPCVCETTICAALLWLRTVVVFIGVGGR